MGSSVRRCRTAVHNPIYPQGENAASSSLQGGNRGTPQSINRQPLQRMAIAAVSMTAMMISLQPRPAFSQLETASVPVPEWFAAGPSAAAAPPPTAPPPRRLAQATAPRSSASNHLLFVNPALGDDASGVGSQRSPFRTITHALEVAPAGSTIFLAAGTYSAASGEQFPIRLRSDITLQGDTSSRGQGILIRGGGEFLSPTFARQNVTLLGASGATLTGVTVTNPNPRGYGLWIESTSPTVLHNTFTGSRHDGISVNGSSRAVIRNNHFHRNGANGITIYGTAQPLVENNQFEETGYGINVGQQATPQLVGNQIVRNRAGVVVQGSARPVLRQNVIAQNQQDGVVAIAAAVPNMGTVADPGENQIQDNGQQDVNAEVAQHDIPVAGNQIDQNRTSGSLDFSGEVAIAPTAASPARSTSAQFPRIVLPFDRQSAEADAPPEPQTANRQESSPAAQPEATSVPSTQPSVAPAAVSSAFPRPSAIESESSPSDESAQFATGGSRPPSTSLEMFVQPTAPAIASPSPTASSPEAPRPEAAPPPTLTTTAPIPIPVIAPRSAPAAPPAAQPQAEPTLPQAEPVAVRPARTEAQAPIPLRVIFPEAQAAAPAPAPVPAAAAPVQATPAAPRPVRNANLLPVPTTSVPTGHLGGLQTIRVASNALNPMTNAQRASMLGLRYRVVVEAGNERAQNAVRSLVPGAFRTRINGRTVMQAGAFASLENANAVARQLVSSGLRAEVQPIE